MPVSVQIVQFLKVIGFFDIFLPFILIYAIVYGILTRTKIFEIDNNEESKARARGLYSLIAFSFAGFTIGSIQVIRGIQQLIPLASILLLTILVLVIIASFTLANEYKNVVSNSKILKAIGIVSIIVLVAILLSIFGIWNYISNVTGQGQGNLDVIAGEVIMGIGLILFMYWITKPPKQSRPEGRRPEEVIKPYGYA